MTIIGLGMWSHEFSVGVTQYLNADKSWHVATSAFYEVHTKKQDTDVRIGDWLVLEGGVGKAFTGGSSLGAAYYAIWQTTNASGADVPGPLRGKKTQGFGLGPEVGFLQGGVVVRALWEFWSPELLGRLYAGGKCRAAVLDARVYSCRLAGCSSGPARPGPATTRTQRRTRRNRTLRKRSRALSSSPSSLRRSRTR